MAETHHTPAPVGKDGRGHETRDADGVKLLKIGGGLLALVAAFMLLVWGLYALFGDFPYRPEQTAPPATAQQNALPPEPRLQPLPQEDLAKMRAHEDSVLQSYGWVNRQTGIARVPIDTAMTMVVQQHLPFRSARDRSGTQGGGERMERTSQ